MKVKLLIYSLSLLALSCGETKDSYKQVSFPLWGTQCDVIYKNKKEVDVIGDLNLLFNDLTVNISTYDSNSVLSRVNANKEVKIKGVIYELLELSKEVHQNTNGLFDPTVRPLVEQWGFLKQKGQWIDTSILHHMLEWVGLEKWEWNDSQLLKKPSNASIDFNAIAPGFAADKVALYLKSKGINDFFINNGGEIVVSGSRPDGTNWQIGVTSPSSLKSVNEYDTLYKITNIALATSGNYINKFEYQGKEYGHTISVKTGMPIQTNIVSATVLAADAATADAFATACMALNDFQALELLRNNGLRGYLICKDNNNKVYRVMVD